MKIFRQHKSEKKPNAADGWRHWKVSSLQANFSHAHEARYRKLTRRAKTLTASQARTSSSREIKPSKDSPRDLAKNERTQYFPVGYYWRFPRISNGPNWSRTTWTLQTDTSHHDWRAVEVACRAAHDKIYHGNAGVHQRQRCGVDTDWKHTPVRLDHVDIDVYLSPGRSKNRLLQLTEPDWVEGDGLSMMKSREWRIPYENFRLSGFLKYIDVFVWQQKLRLDVRAYRLQTCVPTMRGEIKNFRA